MRHLRLSLFVLPLLVACRGVNLSPVTETLEAAATLALAGSAAMTTLAGEGPPCVTLTPACNGAPCVARVEVAVDERCPLPLGVGEGTIILDGDWTSLETATFVPDLTSVDLGVGDGQVQLSLGVVAVQRDGDEVRVAFGEQGVDADSADGGSAGVEQAGFSVAVALGGTPADPADDVLELSGGGQQVVDTDVVQVAVALTRTSPSCRLNPVSGTATLGGTTGARPSSTTLSFHEACDGEADVVASTEDPTLIGSSTGLGLGR